MWTTSDRRSPWLALALDVLIGLTGMLLVPSTLRAQGPPSLVWQGDTQRPFLSFLYWDTEGLAFTPRNMLSLQETNTVGPGVHLDVKIGGLYIPTRTRPTTATAGNQSMLYRIDMTAYAPGLFVVWEITQATGAVLTQRFSLEGAGAASVQGLRLGFHLDPLVTPTAIVPNRWDPDGSFHTPLVINAADFGQMYLADPQGVVQRGQLTGNRHGIPEVYATLDLAAPPNGSNSIRLEPVYLPAPTATAHADMWRRARRAWWNVFQPSSAWARLSGFVEPPGILANNVISTPCALALNFYADSAFWTPQLAPGVSAMTQVRRSTEWWLDNGTTSYGLVRGCLTALPPGGPETDPLPWNALDGNTGVLIAAWDYVAATGDVNWLSLQVEHRMQQLRNVSAFLEDPRRLDASDGLVKCGNSGVYGAPTGPGFRGCDWFDVVNAGHKDAYVNAFAYRAWRGMADLERRLGNPTGQAHYTALADHLKQNYFNTFYQRPDQGGPGWLAWWKDGGNPSLLHDYASITVNGLAIEYGLVPPEEAPGILSRLRTKLYSIGFTCEAPSWMCKLGIPHVLIPILPSDYSPGIYGAPPPDSQDGRETFGTYENGGITAGQGMHFLNAHYVAGTTADAAWADMVLDQMLNRAHKGRFQNGVPHGFGGGVDWTDLAGTTTGYEGFLSDLYRFPQAILLRDPEARARFYAPLNP